MKKNIFPFVILLSFTLTACGNTNSTNAQSTDSSFENLEPIQSGKIKITIDGKVFTFKLADNKATEGLLKTLPFEGSANVYHDNHYYLPTPKGLSVEGLKSTKDAKKGHLVYSAEYKGLGIFFADGHFDENDLFYIGEAEEDMSGFDAKKTVQIKVAL